MFKHAEVIRTALSRLVRLILMLKFLRVSHLACIVQGIICIFLLAAWTKTVLGSPPCLPSHCCISSTTLQRRGIKMPLKKKTPKVDMIKISLANLDGKLVDKILSTFIDALSLVLQ